MRTLFSGVVASLSLFGWAAMAHAAPIIQLVNNYGNQYNNGVWVHTFDNAYGNSNALPPALPVPIVTAITDGVQVTFSPFAFLAEAKNSTGVLTQTFDGTLSFVITFDSPVFLTTRLAEGGGYESGYGTTSVRTDVAISPLDGTGENSLQGVSRHNFVAVGGPFNWSIGQQYSGFNNAHTTFFVSVDNILEAEVLSGQTSSTAWIDKKFFSLTFINVGGGDPPVPEPATLGVLATGCLALLARRRRA